MRRPRTNAPPPDAGSLHQSAVSYLARYAATEAGLARVLARKVDRWQRAADGDADMIAQAAAQAHAAIPAIVARLTQGGAVSDASFAQSRARSLARAGKSRRAISVQLARSGVPGVLAKGALPREEATELAGALIHARKRRMGPWRRGEMAPDAARKELASLARAGYGHGVARQALGLEVDTAEALIAAFRAGI